MTQAHVTSVEKLSESEKRYRAVMEQAGCGISIINGDGKVIEINKEVEKTLRKSPEDITGKYIYDFIPKDQHPHIESLIKKLMVQDTKATNELHLVNDAGEKILIDFSAAPLKISDERLIILMYVDITERAQFRLQAIVNDKLASVGVLASGVAHEINNPIAWVLANLMQMKNTIHTLQTEVAISKNAHSEAASLTPKLKTLFLEFEEMVNDSIQGANRVQNIVQDLIGFTRVSHEDIDLINVHDVIDSALNIASPHYKYKALLEKKFEENLPNIHVNSGKLHQVILNFILNAAQAIPDGKQEENKIKIITAFEDEKVRIDISDTGCGIPSDNLAKIYQPFFTTEAESGGIGLGLSICYEIIRNLNGTVQINTKINEGTTFSIFLPLGNTLLQQTEKNQFTPTNISKKNILIIESEINLLNSLQRFLSTHHDVTTAVGGKAGLELLMKEDRIFDVILCDLAMPDVDGADIYYALQKQSPSITNHMIFIENGDYEAKLNDFINQEPVSCLKKPLDLTELLQTIEKSAT